MSIRKRTWKTAKGDAREAWVVDYVDQAGKRRLKTFKKKKEADAFETRSQFEITQGTHTPDSTSITVAEAAEKWLETCQARGLERSTIDAYAQHIKLHICPFLGRLKLSQISAPGVRDFEDRLRLDGRSPAMVRKILTSLGSLPMRKSGALFPGTLSASLVLAARKASIAALNSARRAG